MNPNNIRRDGGHLEKSWPRLTRPLTLSDITGPSVPNLFEPTLGPDANPHAEIPTESITHSYEQNTVKGRSKMEIECDQRVPMPPPQAGAREENVDSFISKQVKEISDTYMEPVKVPYSAQRQPSQPSDAMEKSYQFHPMPSALMDHDFGFSAAVKDPSIDNSSFSHKHLDENNENYMLQKMEANENEKDSNMETGSSKQEFEMNLEHNDKAELEMDAEENDVNVEEEVYCICRTSDTKRFMMLVYISLSILFIYALFS